MFRRILVATDGSGGAMKAVAAAGELASVGHGELYVLNVFDAREISSMRDRGPREYARAEHLQGDHAEAKGILSEDILAAAKTIVAQYRGVVSTFVSLEGDAAAEILRYAEQVRADTIVLGSRGRGRLAGLLLGSVSQKVASLARQATMIVPDGR